MELLCCATTTATSRLPSRVSFNLRRTSPSFTITRSGDWWLNNACFRFTLRIRRSGAVAYSSVTKSSEPISTSDAGVLGSEGFGDGTIDNFKRSEPSGSVDEFQRELQELFDEVQHMIAVGNHNDALSLLRANFEAVKGQIDAGYKGMEEAALLDVIALGYMRLGGLKMVDTLLEMMNEVVGDIRDDECLLESVIMHMGSMYSSLGKFDKSIVMYQRAASILERQYGDSSIFLVTPLLGMAKALGSIGRTTKATKIYGRALQILELRKGTLNEDLVIPLSGLGNLLIKEGKVNDAEHCFDRIVSIYKDLYGNDDGRVGMALSSLAHAKCAKGEVNEAINLYKNALQIIKDSNFMALDDSLVEKMRIDLAELLHIAGRASEGRELLAECFLISEKHKGKDHPDSVAHLVNLATSYSRSKNFVEAERLLRTGLDIMMKTTGPDDPSISFPMLHLAVTLYNLERVEEAEKLARVVLRIREKAFGKDSLAVGEALDCLISIQTHLGKDDDNLVELLQRVLKIQETEIGYESEEVVETLKKLVFILDRSGRKDEKLQLQRRLSVLKSKYKQMVWY